MFQTKLEDIFPESYLTEMEISDLPNKEFKLMVKMLADIRIAVHEQSKNFSKE